MSPMFGKKNTEDGPEIGKIPQRAAYSVPEVAQFLGGVTDRYVFGLIESGELPSFKLGRRRLVKAEVLEEFIDALVADEAKVRAAARKAAKARHVDQIAEDLARDERKIRTTARERAAARAG